MGGPFLSFNRLSRITPRQASYTAGLLRFAVDLQLKTYFGFCTRLFFLPDIFFTVPPIPALRIASRAFAISP